MLTLEKSNQIGKGKDPRENGSNVAEDLPGASCFTWSSASLTFFRLTDEETEAYRGQVTCEGTWQSRGWDDQPV